MNIGVIRNGFAADETLTDVQRIENYCFHSLPITRLAYVRRIGDCSQNVGREVTKKSILPLLTRILKDQEKDVRAALAEQLGQLAETLAQRGAGPEDADGKEEGKKSENAGTKRDRPKLVDYYYNQTVKRIKESSNSSVPLKCGLDIRQEPNASGGMYLKISQLRNTLHETEIIWGDSKPSWKEFSLDLKDIDIDTPLKFVCWIKEEIEQKTSDFVGQVMLPVTRLLSLKNTSKLALCNRFGNAIKNATLNFEGTPQLQEKMGDLDLQHVSELSGGTTPRKRENKSITRKIIPCVQKLLIDEDPGVREKACVAFVRVASVLDPLQVQTNVLTVVLLLAHDENEQHKIVAAKLIASLSSILGPLLCSEFCAPELLHLADDPKCSVRKAAVQSFGKIAKVAGSESTTKKLMQSFRAMAKDQVWSVRKAVVEQMVEMASTVSDEESLKVFGLMFEGFASDASRWVRNSAFEVLGRLIHTLGNCEASKSLLVWFCRIPSLANTKIDQECTFFCAYNFPAVCHTMGFNKNPELPKAFIHLCKDSRFPVRRALAFSLHELAYIVGPDMTHKYLVAPFEKFLKDATNEVREGVIQGLGFFLSMLDHSAREKYLTEIWNIVRNSQKNWRFRELMAKQLPSLTRIFSTKATRGSISSLFSFLCRDEVAAVRRRAVIAVPHLLDRLYRDAGEEGCGHVVEEVDLFADSKTYKERQLFLLMGEAMLSMNELHPLFKSIFLPKLLKAAGDSVINVRICFCRNILPKLTKANALEADDMKALMDRLNSDPDVDVKDLLLGGLGSIDKKKSEDAIQESKAMVVKVESWIAERKERQAKALLDMKAPPAPKDNAPQPPQTQAQIEENELAAEALTGSDEGVDVDVDVGASDEKEDLELLSPKQKKTVRRGTLPEDVIKGSVKETRHKSALSEGSIETIPESLEGKRYQKQL